MVLMPMLLLQRKQADLFLIHFADENVAHDSGRLAGRAL